jgi:hypothetical protein
VAQLAALKKADSYERGDMIKRGGWVTMPPATRTRWPELRIFALRSC